MLPRSARLVSSQEIVATVRRGRKIRTPQAIIYILLRPDQPGVRISCIVGKKVHAGAVQRHRYQRWLREAMRPLAASKNLLADIVVTALPAIKDIESLAELKDYLSPYLKDLALE